MVTLFAPVLIRGGDAFDLDDCSTHGYVAYCGTSPSPLSIISLRMCLFYHGFRPLFTMYSDFFLPVGNKFFWQMILESFIGF